MARIRWTMVFTVVMLSAVGEWCAGGVSSKVDLVMFGASTNATNIEVDGKSVEGVNGSIQVEANAVHTFRWAEPMERTILLAATEGFDKLVPPAVWQTNLAAVQASYGGYKLSTGTAEGASLSMVLSKAIAAARGSLAGADEKDPVTNRTDLLEWRIVPSTKGVGVACLIGMVTGRVVSVPIEATTSGPIPGWVFAPARALSEYKEVDRVSIGVGAGKMAVDRARTQAMTGMSPSAVTTTVSDRPGLMSRRTEVRYSGTNSGPRTLATWEMVFEGQYTVFILMGASAP